MVQEARGVLVLDDAADARLAGRGGSWIGVRLDGEEGGNWLERAQAALWELRKSCGWVCVAANRTGAGAAAALAAQLPVDRLALTGSKLFDRCGPRLAGQAARLERFARRNLALVASEVLLIGASDREIRGFASMFGRRRVCALEEGGENFYTAPWGEVNENNLLIPRKCV